MKTFRLTLAALFTLCAIYLFASAPPPLDAQAMTGRTGEQIDVTRLFDALDAINGAARAIYTERIVAAGATAGLAFGEDWAEPGQEKGPLPALFLRLVAARLEAMPPPVGLYLGSDQPINASNLFTGAQADLFADIRLKGGARIARIDGVGVVALYADVASANGCVACHNAHPDSPRKDWRLGDVMGATTWTYPDTSVSPAAYLAAITALYRATGDAWDAYLAKAAQFADPPLIGADWPDTKANRLPDRSVFLAEVRRASAAAVLDDLIPPTGESP